MFIDSHCHLTDERYGDASEIISSFERDGIEAVVTVGYDTASSVACVRLAENNERVFASVGLHPSEFTHEHGYEGILPLLGSPKVVAYGEIGLDYHYDEPSRDLQKRTFREQLDLAIASRLPVIVHARDCDGDMMPILRSYAPRLTDGLVMHCFSSSAEIAKECVRLGFFVSFAGTVTFKNANKGDVVRVVPDELLLAETDAPYLTPVPHRGEINYPKYTAYTLQKLAEFRSQTFERVSEITANNAKKLFKKMGKTQK